MVSGEIIDCKVIIKDEKEASKIYNKGYYGTPLAGGMLKLELEEAIYLFETERLIIERKGKRIGQDELFKMSEEENFDIKYIVFKDMRERGYIVKSMKKPFHYIVYPRGGVPKKSDWQYFLCVFHENSVFKTKEILSSIEFAERANKQILFGLVDDEGDITYYDICGVRLSRIGTVGELGFMSDAFFVDNTVFIFDSNSAKKIFDIGFYGIFDGEKTKLSLIETAYLVERGGLSLYDLKTNKKIPIKKLMRIGKKLEKDFENKFAVYKALRNLGYIVKTGFKYGTDFRVYDGDPTKQHAPYLFYIVPENFSCRWAQASMAIRLAHGVRKEIVFAVGGKEYIKLKRIRP
ncbi:MAG: tRNA-intron lyase [Candidatus Thermoplasmatota archaeon]